MEMPGSPDVKSGTRRYWGYNVRATLSKVYHNPLARVVLIPWLLRLPLSRLDSIMSHRMVQGCAALITWQVLMHIDKRLDPSQTTEEVQLGACWLAAIAAVGLLGLRYSILLAFCQRSKWFILLNGVILPGLVPAIAQYVDQQVTDAEGLPDVALYIAQAMLFFAPVRTLKLFGFLVVSAICHIIFRLSPYHERLAPQMQILSRMLQLLSKPLVSGWSSLQTVYIHVAHRFETWLIKRDEYRLSQCPQLNVGRSYPLGVRQIRLIRLSRKQPFLAPQLEMLVVSVDHALAYEAVSHAWQYPFLGVKIAMKHGYHLEISQNIYDFLSHRRSYVSSKLIWIDALCIDQHSIEERQAQVLLMKDVFSKAARVIVWLGMSPSASEAVIIRNHFWLTRMHQKIMRNPEKLLLLMWPEADVKTALSALLQHRWFTRVWMVQEVALARKVHLLLGQVCLGWHELKTFVFTTRDARLTGSFLELISHSDEVRTDVHARALGNIEQMSRIRRRVSHDYEALQTDPGGEPHHADIRPSKEAAPNQPLLSLQRVLTGATTFNATDPRDKIFALLGLITDPNVALPAPDYRSPFRTVYLDAVQKSISIGDIEHYTLTLAGVGLRKKGLAREMQGLPSWVPDFVSGAGSAGMIDHERRFSRKMKIQLCETTGAIKAPAKLLDALTTLGPVVDIEHDETRGSEGPERPLSSLEKSRIAASWVIETKAYAERCCREIDMVWDERAFWRTLFTDRYADVSPIPADTLGRMDSVHRLCLRTIGHDAQASIDPERTPKSRNEDGNVALSLSSTSLGRSFAITVDNKFVMAPPLAQEGDNLCYFEGSSEPFLVRRADAGNWQLVGACYVDGFAVQEPEFEEITIV